MRNVAITGFGALAVVIALAFTGCTDVLKGAFTKGEDYSPSEGPTTYVTDFAVSAGENNREAFVSWVNPVRSDFGGVRLMRRTDRYPDSDSDPDAVLLYEGTGNRYIDRGLLDATTYYYAIYTIIRYVYSSRAFYGSFAVADTATDIRMRSFFITGGASTYPDPTTGLVAGVDMFDPVMESISTAVTTLPGPRVFCTATSLGNKIYVIGGKDGSGVSGRVDILDVASLTWTTGTAMPQPRCAHSAVVYNGRIHVLGGSTTTTSGGAVATNYIYDPATDSWTQNALLCADLTSTRCAFSTAVYGGMLYYFGGVTTTGVWQNSGQYRSLFTNQSTALSGFLYYVGCNYAFYHKQRNDGSETAFYMTFGGSNTNTQTALPAASLNLTAGGNYVYATFIPNLSGGAPTGTRITPLDVLTGIEGYTNRVYSGSEYFGDYIYLIGGLAGSPTAAPSTLIERLDVKDGNLFYGEWRQLTTALGTGRYGFGITRVRE